MSRFLFALTACCGLGLFAPGAHAHTDDFNRQALGPSWEVQVGDPVIEAGRVHSSDGGHGFATYTPAAGLWSASVDILLDGSGAPQYGALALGYGGGGSGAFLAVQNNGNGLRGVQNLLFYTGHNDRTGGAMQAVYGLEEVTALRLTATLDGRIATVGLDVDFDGVPEQVLSYEYPFWVPSFGSGVGMASYGGVRMDNFTTSAVPEPQAWLLLVGGLLVWCGLPRRLRRA